MDIRAGIGRFVGELEWRTHAKWMLLSVLVGIVAGLGAILFQTLTQAVMRVALERVAGYHVQEPVGEHALFAHLAGELNPWLLVLVATAGGLVSGLIVYTLAPEAEGHGTDAAIDAFHNKRGAVRPRIPLIKTITSAITIGTGGSGGREGPIAQIGAGFGSALATLLKLPVRDRRILLAAGMGAGVGAIFRAPLAGSLFAAEILYSDSEFEADVIVPAALSSIISYTVYTLSLPASIRYVPLFGSELRYGLNSPLEMVFYAALSLVLAGMAILYIRVFYSTHAVFQRLPLPPHLRPAVGAGLAALLAVGLLRAFGGDQRVLAVLSTGYGALQETLTSAAGVGVPLLVTIALAKIVTTSLTISSGGSGGVFGPSMVIGGCTGGAVGQMFHRLWPEVVPRPEAFALVGMAGFFAGAAHAPISTIIMVTEMTGDYALLLPTMFCSTLCFVLCRRWKLYSRQVPSRLESPAHRGDFIVDLLEGIKVQEVYRPLSKRLALIPESMPLADVVRKLSETEQHYFPVIDTRQRMVGIFSSQDVRRYLYDQSLWQLAVANDVMVSNVITVTPADDLNTALTRFTARNLDELPVVAEDDPGRILGMLRRKETIAYYNQRLMQHKQAVAD